MRESPCDTRGVLAQREMGSRPDVVRELLSEHAVQSRRVYPNHVIDGLASLKELAVDPGRAQQRVRSGHFANQCADIGWTSRPSSAMSALPRPEQTKPRRRHAKTVTDCTRWSAVRQPCHRCDSQAHSARSTAVNRSRERRERFAMASWCRSATISRCSAAHNEPTTVATGAARRPRAR